MEWETPAQRTVDIHYCVSMPVWGKPIIDMSSFFLNQGWLFAWNESVLYPISMTTAFATSISTFHYEYFMIPIFLLLQ